MLSLLRSNIAVTLVVCLLLAATHFAAWQRGASGERVTCAEARAETETRLVQSLAEATRRATEADTEVNIARAEARALAEKRLRETTNEVSRLPDRGCGFTDDERRLLDSQVRASFPTIPAGVPDEVQRPTVAPE